MLFRGMRTVRRSRFWATLLTASLALSLGGLGAAASPDAAYGDVDGNGTVDASDALMVLQSSVQLRTLTADQAILADVNTDGKIDASDALNILQKSVGLIHRFDAEPIEGRNGRMIQYRNGAYVQTRDAMEMDGARTTFQVSAPFDGSMALPADMVMVYDTEDRGWAGQGYTMAAMQMMNKADGNEYHTQHPEDLQIQADGRGIYGSQPGEGRPWNDIISESSRNSYQSQEFIDWQKQRLTRMVENYHPQTVVFEEPEYFRRGLYGEGYKELWKQHYGSDWVDPISSPEAVLLSQRLNVALECNAIHQLSDHYKSLNPSGLFGVAAHSHFNYRAHDITAGIYSMAATGKVDAIIGQAWSDTIKHSFLYNGREIQRPFLLGYLEYATYIDAAVKNDAQLFALIDPMSDEREKHTEEQLRALNRHQVASSLMHPEINRWENCIWPDRAFRDVSGDYKTELLSIYNALNDVSGEAYALTAGTPGVTYLMSDTFTWQITGQNWCEDPKQSYYGVAMPLIDDGIPLEIAAMDYLNSAEDLQGVSLLIVSYDSMKPMSEQVNRAIADWVKQGGTLLYVGGHDAYEKVASEWWNQPGMGGSPFNNLLSHLGLDSVTVGSFEDMTLLEYAGPAESAALFEGKTGLVNDITGHVAAYSGEGFSPLLCGMDGEVLAMEASSGKGRLISVGLPGYYFASTGEGADWMKALCRYAMRYTGLRYVTSPAFVAERGRYTAVHALHEDYTLEGRYVDIFDSSLSIVTDPVVSAGASGLYYRVEETGSGIPSALFFGGRLEGEVSQTSECTALTLTGPSNSVSAIRLFGAGKVPSAIRATQDGKEYPLVLTQWRNADGSLLIQLYNAAGQPVKIEVDWTLGTKPDDPPRSFSEQVITTGVQGNDEAYIVRFTGASQGDIRYCDLTAELVYRLDLSQYPGGWLTLTISNNYLVEVSDRDGDWREAYNYKTLSGGDYATSGSNQTSLTIVPGEYGMRDEIYLRIRNCYPDRGWGGCLHNIHLHYVEG